MTLMLVNAPKQVAIDNPRQTSTSQRLLADPLKL